MPLPRSIRRTSLVALAIAVCLGTAGPVGTTPDAAAQQRPDCANFLDQEDAQVAFDADRSDPFGLDGDNDGVVCQEPADGFGTAPLVNCDDLQGHPDIARALYDHSLSKYEADSYNLVGCVEQGTTDTSPAESVDTNGGSRGDDPEVLDGVPPESGGGRVFVSTGALGTGESLEARLEARFAALEAQFAAFEARAANGFGMFPESGDEVTAGGQATSVVVSTAQEPVAVAQRTLANDDRASVRAQKVKDGKGERGKERKSKRDRHKGKHRHRR